jgi:hypothetical protein
MRRNEAKEFKVYTVQLSLSAIFLIRIYTKGSVFVEFADSSSADAFLKADPKPSWNGEELLIMSKYVSGPAASPCGIPNSELFFFF